MKRATKITKIIKERTIIKKKIRALKNLKSYKKDLFLQTKNIDEIFYVDRNRQKNYMKIVNSESILMKINCMKNDKKKMVI